MLPIEPALPRSDEDKRGWPGRQLRGVRTEAIVREAEAVSVMKKETCPLGGIWGDRGEREVLLGAYFILSS